MSSNLEWEKESSLTGQVTSTAVLSHAAAPGVARSRLARTRGRMGYFVAALRQHPQFGLGYVIVVGVVLIGLLAPWLAPYSPITAHPSEYLQPPGWGHPMGTDSTGMDILSRVMFAPRIDLTIAMLGTLVSATLGTVLGALVGYYQSARGLRALACDAIVRASDVLQAFPVFVFAIALVAIFGQSIQSIIAAIAFVNIPIYLRLMRSQVMAVRSMRYVEAAIVCGVGDLTIIRRHAISNAIAPVLAQLSVNIGFAIILTASLSFVGAGVRAPTPEWGSMIAMGFQNVTTGQWWTSVFPGVALAVTVFGFALDGASIEFLADPERRATIVDRSDRVRPA
ncbi:MAG: ABC transporter permease [Geminicoccaceae bacterium]